MSEINFAAGVLSVVFMDKNVRCCSSCIFFIFVYFWRIFLREEGLNDALIIVDKQSVKLIWK